MGHKVEGYEVGQIVWSFHFDPRLMRIQSMTRGNQGTTMRLGPWLEPGDDTITPLGDSWTLHASSKTLTVDRPMKELLLELAAIYATAGRTGELPCHDYIPSCHVSSNRDGYREYAAHLLTAANKI